MGNKYRYKNRRKGSTLQVWLVAILAVVAVGGLIALSQGSVVDDFTVVDKAPDAELNADRNAWGSPDARVELIEYGDYL